MPILQLDFGCGRPLGVAMLRAGGAMPDKLVNIKADSVEEFMEKVSDAVGEGEGIMGVTDYDIGAKVTTDSNGKIKTVTFKVDISIKRAHWAGGKADDKNKKAIQAAEAANKKHEENHKKLIEQICAREFAKAAKDLKGKDQDELQDAVDAIKKKVDDANEKLDDKEGKTEVKPQSNGSFTVKQVGR
jgi:predicted secreted Zn-dependent protease